MPAKKYPNMTQVELMEIYHQLGNWYKVAEHLGLSQSGLDGLKSRFGAKGGASRNQNRKYKSALDPYLDQIRVLASQGYTCQEMVDELGLSTQSEQVRRILRKHNIPLLSKQGAQPGEKHRDWKGGRIYDKYGYILLYMPDHPDSRAVGYILEHRYVMEQHLGRRLTPDEVVHHKNDIKDDNRIENLELFSSNAEHLSETLQGKVPEWTDEGIRRIREGIDRSIETRQRKSRAKSSNRQSSKSDDLG